jgi:Domain of unknown function (DUF4360)
VSTKKRRIETITTYFLENVMNFKFAIAAVAFVATSAMAQPNPSQVFIRQISHAGTGCPAGTVASNLSSDAKAFTLLFDSFVAEAGPGVALSAGRKNCQILVDLQYPQGWSYSIFTFDYRGFAQLDAQVMGEQTARYYFQGTGTSVPMTSRLYGPTAQDYHFRDQLGVTALIWSPCGAARALNINTSVGVRASNRNARGLMTVDSMDGEVKHIYGIQWRSCR